MEKAYLNIKEASQYLGVSRSTIYRLIEKGLKTTTVFEARKLIKITDLEEFIHREEGTC